MEYLAEYTWLVVIACIVLLVMGFAVGANDVGNAFATSVGSRCLCMRHALMICAVMEFVGALALGGNVTNTIAQGIADLSTFQRAPGIFMYGMLCSISSATIICLAATLYELPVSTAHSVVAAVVAFALVYGGPDAVVWYQRTKEYPYFAGVLPVFGGWLLSPFVAAIVAGCLFVLVRTLVLRRPHSLQISYWMLPLLVLITIFINVFFILYKEKGIASRSGLTRDEVVWISAICAAGASFLTGLLVVPLLKRNIKNHIERRTRHRSEKISKHVNSIMSASNPFQKSSSSKRRSDPSSPPPSNPLARLTGDYNPLARLTSGWGAAKSHDRSQNSSHDRLQDQGRQLGYSSIDPTVRAGDKGWGATPQVERERGEESGRRMGAAVAEYIRSSQDGVPGGGGPGGGSPGGDGSGHSQGDVVDLTLSPSSSPPGNQALGMAGQGAAQAAGQGAPASAGSDEPLTLLALIPQQGGGQAAQRQLEHWGSAASAMSHTQTVSVRRSGSRENYTSLAALGWETAAGAGAGGGTQGDSVSLHGTPADPATRHTLQQRSQGSSGDREPSSGCWHGPTSGGGGLGMNSSSRSASHDSRLNDQDLSMDIGMPRSTTTRSASPFTHPRARCAAAPAAAAADEQCALRRPQSGVDLAVAALHAARPAAGGSVRGGAYAPPPAQSLPSPRVGHQPPSTRHLPNGAAAAAAPGPGALGQPNGLHKPSPAGGSGKHAAGGAGVAFDWDAIEAVAAQNEADELDPEKQAARPHASTSHFSRMRSWMLRLSARVLMISSNISRSNISAAPEITRTSASVQENSWCMQCLYFDVLRRSWVEIRTGYTMDGREPETWLGRLVHGFIYAINYDVHDLIDQDDDTHELHLNAERFDPDTEQTFKLVQVFTASVAAFSHGANDLANTIGPFAAIWAVYKLGTVDDNTTSPIWALAIASVGVVIGLAACGYKIIGVLGVKSVAITPSRGFSIELSTALIVALGSHFGIPLSTTHCQVGGTGGVGLAEGSWRGVSARQFRRFFWAWVGSIVFAALLSAGLFIQGTSAPSLSISHQVSTVEDMVLKQATHMTCLLNYTNNAQPTPNTTITLALNDNQLLLDSLSSTTTTPTNSMNVSFQKQNLGDFGELMKETSAILQEMGYIAQGAFNSCASLL